MYRKPVVIDLYGNDPQELQKVAAHIRKQACSHELVINGKDGRRVGVAHGTSVKPKKVFDGLVG